MFATVCSRCRGKLELPDTLAGKLVKCPKCDRTFLAPELDEVEHLGEDAEEVQGGQPRESPSRVTGRTLILVSGLILFVFVATFGIILVTKAKRSPDPVENKTTQPAAESSLEIKAKKALDTSLSLGLLVFLMLLIAAYVVLVYWCGIWMGVDASRRGMGYMGWFVFFFAYQFVSRFVIAFLIVGFHFLIDGPWLMFLVEPLHWIVVVYYLLVRKKGILARCKTCGNLRLYTLRRCPHCDL